MTQLIMQQKLGCKHYPRGCQVKAPCCGLFYSCRLCHDQLYKGVKAEWCKVELMEFRKVEMVRCLKCGLEQDKCQKCIGCGLQFGAYTCLKCALFDNTPGKKIMHCDKCGMCRIGLPSELQHCDGCGVCFSKQTYLDHKCYEVEGYNCPVCLQELKHSTKGFFPMAVCGHFIHVKCYNQYVKHNTDCPQCGRALVSMTAQQKARGKALAEASRNEIPPQLKEKIIQIWCKECNKATKDLPFNFYPQCGSCGSFLVKMV